MKGMNDKVVFILLAIIKKPIFLMKHHKLSLNILCQNIYHSKQMIIFAYRKRSILIDVEICY